MRYVAAYFASVFGMAALDLVWLKLISNAFFRAQVGSLLSDDPNVAAAALFYVFFAAGLIVFAIAPGLKAGSLAQAVAYGAGLGFLAYMTFDLTCLAILKGWTVPATLVDIAWGTCVSAAAAGLGYGAASIFSR